MATVRLHRAAMAAVHKAAGHDDPTDNEGVRRILQGISRAHVRAQKQVSPLTAEALAAAKATANSRRPLGGRGKGQESAQTVSYGLSERKLRTGVDPPERKGIIYGDSVEVLYRDC